MINSAKSINDERLIEKQEETIKSLKEIIIQLKSEISELKKLISSQKSTEQTNKSLSELIHEMREENNKLIKKKDDEQRTLKNRLDEIELDKKMIDLKNIRNNTIYSQKMSVIHEIEMENKIYKEEVNDLKKKNEELKLITKTKIESLDILNQLKFSQFKKKMINNLKEAKNNVSKLNLEYMDLNGKITLLQNHQLLSEVEYQKHQYEVLEKENKALKEKIIDLEKEILIQKIIKKMESKEDKKDPAEGMTADQIREKLLDYEMKRWQEDRGKYVEFDIKTMNKYQKYYEEMTTINPDGEEGIGVDQLEEPFISLGLAYNREEINNLISSVDDDGSGRIEFGEFLRIIHNRSKIKSQGNKKITTFFKQLANDKLGGDSDLKHFSFKTIMDIMRRKNLLKAFLSKNPEEKKEGEKVLKAYSEMLQKRKNK